MKLRKSTTPMTVINADTVPINKIAKKGARKRFRRDNAFGQTPSRASVKVSRVALSMDELMEVNVAKMPAMAIKDTPIPGRKREIESVRAVSELANVCQGRVPKVTAMVDE